MFTVAFLPLIMTAIPLGILFAMGAEGEIQDAASDIPQQFKDFCPSNLSGGECFQVYMVSQFMIMFMILPLAIPASISAYSIVGEKVARSLEPLLATPITTGELLIGKSLAALVPAVLATYTAFLIYAVGVRIIIPDRQLFAALMDARWLLAIIVVGPLMALMAVNFSIMVSSRVNDPRVAEQLSMIVIIPVLALFFAQLGGLLIINSQLVLGMAFILVVLDGILVFLAVQTFQRETILTRWR